MIIRREFQPALGGSVALHAIVALLAMISWHFGRDLKVGAVVPVNIVTDASRTDLRAAEQAPVEQTAQIEEPTPQAPPEVTPPPPPAAAQPSPTPPAKPVKPVEKLAPEKPPPVAKPNQKAPPEKPQPAAKPAQKTFDLDSLAASLAHSVRNQPQRASSASKGASRSETAQQTRPDLGSGEAAAAVSGMTEELQRRWNPNCDVEGGRDVVVRVGFRLNAAGQVVGAPVSQIRGPANAVATAAAERAVRAVYAAAPFRGLPRQFYGSPISVNFIAREACS